MMTTETTTNLAPGTRVVGLTWSGTRIEGTLTGQTTRGYLPDSATPGPVMHEARFTDSKGVARLAYLHSITPA